MARSRRQHELASLGELRQPPRWSRSAPDVASSSRRAVERVPETAPSASRLIAAADVGREDEALGSASASAATPVVCSVPLISASPSRSATAGRATPARPSPPAGQELVLEPGFPAPDQRQRHVRERREIAAGADRAALGHERVTPAFSISMSGSRVPAGADEAGREHVGAERQHRADRSSVTSVADARGVALQDVLLRGGCRRRPPQRPRGRRNRW